MPPPSRSDRSRPPRGCPRRGRSRRRSGCPSRSRWPQPPGGLARSIGGWSAGCPMPTVRTVGDQEPIHGRSHAADGDRDARRRLASAQAPALAAAVLRIVGDPRRVEPIVAAVLDEACGSDLVLHSDRASVNAWLFALARRHLAANEPAPRSDHLRQAAPQSAVPRSAIASVRRPLDVVPRRLGLADHDPEPRRARGALGRRRGARAGRLGRGARTHAARGTAAPGASPAAPGSSAR